MKTKLILIVVLVLIQSACITAQFDHVHYLDSIYWNGQYDEVIEYAEKEIKNEQTLYQEIGINYYLAHSYTRTIQFAKAWEIATDNYERSKLLKFDDSLHTRIAVDVCQRLGDYSYSAEEYKLGVEALERGISIAETHLSNDYWRLVKLYHKAGAVYRLKNDYKTAIERLDKGYSLISNLPEEKRKYIIPVYQAERAEIYNDTNNPKKAIDIYNDMIVVATADNNLTRMSIYNNNCGLAYERLHDFGKAKYHFDKCLDARLKKYGEKSRHLITAYTNIGRVLVKLGDHKKAQEYFSQLEVLIPEIYDEESYVLADNAFNKGSSYFVQGEFEEALSQFERSEKIRMLHVGDENLELSDARQMIGQSLIKLGKIEQGIAKLELSKTQRAEKNLRQDYELSNTYGYLFDAYTETGNELKAKEALEASFSCIGYDLERRTKFEELQIPAGLITPLSNKLKNIRSELNKNNAPQILTSSQSLISIAESLIKHLKFTFDDVGTRRVLAEKIHPLYQSIFELYYKAYEVTNNEEFIDLAFSAIERSSNNFLYENIAETESFDNSVSRQIIIKKKEKLNEISNLQSEIVKLSLDNSTDASFMKTLEKLYKSKEELYAIIESIQSKYPNYYEKMYEYPVTTIAKTQKDLKDKEALVSYYFGENHLYVIVLSQSKKTFHKLVKKEMIDQNIIDFVSAIRTKSQLDLYTATNNYLYQNLILSCNLGSFKELNIVADGALNLLPFDVLKNTTTNEFMLTETTISYQYSATLKANKNTNKSKLKDALVMAPVFKKKTSVKNDKLRFTDILRNDTNVPLLESENEANSISKIYDGSIYLHEHAKEEIFKQDAQHYRIIHLATHGFVDQINPNKSKLYFSLTDSTSEDGLLYADEIANMSLSPDLVTLSACNTGVGKDQKGEGIASLGRAFAYAGGTNQLLSLWAVNDRSTTQLMSNYYSKLKEGQSKSEALRSAKLEYLESSPELMRHPFYWAGFVYYGENSPLSDASPTKHLGIISGAGIGLLLLGLYFKYSARREEDIS